VAAAAAQPRIRGVVGWNLTNLETVKQRTVAADEPVDVTRHRRTTMNGHLTLTGRCWALLCLVSVCVLVADGCERQTARAESAHVEPAADKPSTISVDQRQTRPWPDRRENVTNEGDTTESGIEGQISFGPISPVARPGMANYRPYQASINVLDEQRRVVAQVQSDVDGRFRVVLPLGRYVLDPQHGGRRPRAAQQVVTVHPGALTPVRVNYDSGMR
jgi:hypothetical protein